MLSKKESDEIGYECVFFTKRHAQLIYDWKMHPSIRTASRDTSYQSFDTFYNHFASKFVTHFQNFVYFVTFRGEKIGVFRLHPESIDTLEVSIFLDPKFQNQGFGLLVLQKGIEYAKGLGKPKLKSYIKSQSMASKKIFQKAGFRFLRKENELEVYEKSLYFHFDSTYIIAEAGSNWMVGNSEENKRCAQKMMEVAAQSGCNAIKFQTFRKDQLYAKGASSTQYLEKVGIHQSMEDLFSKIEMPLDMIEWLYHETQKMNLDFLSSVFSKTDFLAVDPFVKMHKIASYELKHLELLELCAQSKKPLILSTGASKMDDVAFAVNYFREQKGIDLVLMQCTASYPTPIEKVNLNALKDLSAQFQTSVGLSDHSMDVIVPVLSVAMGANVIEKHFTLSRKLEGPDHFFALEPDELKQMCQEIRKCEKGLKNFGKKIEDVENELFIFAKRRLHVTKRVEKGQKLIYKQNFDLLRSGDKKIGLDPNYLAEVNESIAKVTLLDGDGIAKGDFDAT